MSADIFKNWGHFLLSIKDDDVLDECFRRDPILLSAMKTMSSAKTTRESYKKLDSLRDCWKVILESGLLTYKPIQQIFSSEKIGRLDHLGSVLAEVIERDKVKEYHSFKERYCPGDELTPFGEWLNEVYLAGLRKDESFLTVGKNLKMIEDYLNDKTIKSPSR